jgi:chemosensory pili system protein ChpA (sensor histidine kinase/response regulator)
VQRGSSVEARAALERLADAIVSLEYYMETIQAGRREPDWMLDNAGRSLDALTLPEISAPAGSEDLPATQVISPPFVPEVVQPAWTGPSADRPVVADTGEGIDPEILELFIEEAREAIEAINTNFPRWALDDSETDALQTVRRAYHTLKGSGRMVGAELIGEYCWSIEHLLNRVIDGTVANSQALGAFLQRANTAIAELLEQLEAGTEPSSDIAALIAEAEALGRPVAAPEAQADSSDATEVLALPSIEAALGRAKVLADEQEPTLGPVDATMVATHVSFVPPGMDPVLLDILSREVDAHLAVLRSFVAAGSDSLRQPLPEEVFRACHTLHGNLTMAGVSAAVEVSELLNDLVSVLYMGHLPADQAVLDACAQSIEVVAAIIVQLSDPMHAVPETTALKASLRQLAVTAAERAAAQSAEPGDGGTVSMQLPVITDADLPGVAPELEEMFAGAEPEVEHEPELEPESEPEPEPEPVAQAAVPAEIPATGTLSGFDEEVAAIYAEEATEILEVCDQALARLSSGHDQDQALAELQRGLHTLKGGARMAGLFAMGDLSHELETLLSRVSDGLLPKHDATFALVRTAFDELHALRDAIPAGAVTALPSALMVRLAAALRGELSDESPSLPVPPVEEVLLVEAEPVHEEAPAEEEPLLVEEEPLPADEQPVVDLGEPLDFDLEADLNDVLAAETATGMHFELPPVEAELPAAEAAEDAASCASSRSRPRAQILHRHENEQPSYRSEFDPLELDRYSSSSSSRARWPRRPATSPASSSCSKPVAEDAEPAAAAGAHRHRAAERPDAHAHGAVPAPRAAPGAHRAPGCRRQRQAGRTRSSMAPSGELDRQVLERMLPPFEHMLRNAVVHGIETPEAERAAGKSGRRIRMRCTRGRRGHRRDRRRRRRHEYRRRSATRASRSG